MKVNLRLTISVLAAIVVLSGCFTIDDSKYDKLYSGKFVSLQKMENDKKQETENGKQIMDNGGRGTDNEIAVKPAITPGKQAAIAMTPALEPAPLTTKRAPAAAKAKAGKKKKVDIKEMTIRSDKMKYNRESSVATFLNNVSVDASGVNVTGDKLTSKDYKESAEVTGKVEAYYREYDIRIKCRNLAYQNGMKDIRATDKVIVTKIMSDGNTLTMKADDILFETETSLITAVKMKKRVTIILDDIMVFCDKVVYNEESEELEITGNPVLKKKESMFLSKKAVIDANTRTVKLSGNIWSKLFYKEFEDAEKQSGNKDSE